jgi:hypothetical protein
MQKDGWPHGAPPHVADKQTKANGARLSHPQKAKRPLARASLLDSARFSRSYWYHRGGTLRRFQSDAPTPCTQVCKGVRDGGVPAIYIQTSLLNAGDRDVIMRIFGHGSPSPPSSLFQPADRIPGHR